MKKKYYLIILMALCLLLTQSYKIKNTREFYFSGGLSYQGGEVKTSTCYVVVNRNYDDETLIDRILDLYILMNGKPTYLSLELYTPKNREEPYATYDFDFSDNQN